MFTGLIEALATVRDVVWDGPGRRIAIDVPWPDRTVALGDSIALNGVCLTVVGQAGEALEFQAGPETLARSNLGQLRVGDRVNAERALLPTTRLGGHFVQGHVDGVATVADRRREQDWEFVEFRAERSIVRQLVPKGSIALDGVSLTIVTVNSGLFSVMLIPHTLQNTTLGLREVGAIVNVETDILGKYVFQAIQNFHADP